MSNYSSMDGVLYCKPHFEQLFKESGDFRRNFQTGKQIDHILLNLLFSKMMMTMMIVIAHHNNNDDDKLRVL